MALIAQGAVIDADVAAPHALRSNTTARRRPGPLPFRPRPMHDFMRRLAGIKERGRRITSPALVAGSYALLVGLLIALNLYTLIPRRQDYIAAEQEHLLRLGYAIGGSFEYVLNLTDFATASVAAQMASDDATPQKTHDILDTVNRSLPFIRTIRIVGVDGNVEVSSLRFPAHPVGLSDRDYVSYYLKGGRDPVYVSALHRDPVDDVWEISVSRPIFDRRGAMTGIQVAAIDLDYLRKEMLAGSYAMEPNPDPGLRNNYSVTLVDRNLRVVTRDPWVEADIGKALARGGLFQVLADSGSDRFTGLFQGILAGGLRIGAAQWLAEKRFAIAASVPANAVLQPWRHEATTTLSLSLIVFAAMTFVLVQAARNERKQADYVTRLAATNAELEVQTSRAQSSAVAKGNFLANMSHEIRTPLTGIIGYSGLALEDKALSEETRHYLKLIHSASNNLRTVIDDILDLAKIESGKVVLASAPFSMRELVDNCASLAEPIAKVKGLELRKRFDPAIPPWLTGDGARTQQIMLNLINNAIKFTAKGHVEVAAKLEGMADGIARVRISVRDTGIGIAPEKRSLLFNRFQQADETVTRKFGGTGLGLAISKVLVTAMQGEIGVDSTPGQGSDFWFRFGLPVSAGPPAERIEPAAAAAMRPLKILVVDDSAMNADLVEALLGRLGHQAETVADGASAVHACATERYDVVFMDVQMPGMDGMEATRRIRALNAHYANLPIVAMTANVMPDQVAEYRVAGMSDHLGKPIDIERLRAILAHVARSAPPAAAATAATAEAGAAMPVFDRAVFDHVRGALGPERTLRHLQGFSEQLARDIWRCDGDHNEIMTRAHKIVAGAGQFGFRQLSLAARDLENAIRLDGDVEAALKKFNEARMEAAPALMRLMTGEPAPAAPTTRGAA